MMFFLIIFHWSAMDGHSKREVSETDLKWIKKMLLLDFFS